MSDARNTIAIRVVVPAGVDFADLQLTRSVTGSIKFSFPPLRTICDASGLDLEALAAEDHITSIMVTWYGIHRQLGGAPDAVMEELLAEVEAENAAGGYSFLPGHA